MKSKSTFPYKVNYILYLVFNTAWMLIFVYQAYLWMRTGKWVVIPTHKVIPRWAAFEASLVQWDGLGSVCKWILEEELMYVLCVIAMIFYIPKFRKDLNKARGKAPEAAE